MFIEIESSRIDIPSPNYQLFTEHKQIVSAQSNLPGITWRDIIPHTLFLSVPNMPFQLKDFDSKKFPVPLDQYKPVPLSLKDTKLSAEQKQGLQKNIDILRDAIVFFTASGAARGGE